MVLVSEHKNIYKSTNNPVMIEKLKELGYTEVKEETKPFTPKKKPKKEEE